MKHYTIEIHHYEELGLSRNLPREILEFDREGLTRRDWNNICISLMYGIDSSDDSVDAEIYVDGSYQFLVSLWRGPVDPKHLCLVAIRDGKCYGIRSYREAV